jgi:hypothetical protein
MRKKEGEDCDGILEESVSRLVCIIRGALSANLAGDLRGSSASLLDRRETPGIPSIPLRHGLIRLSSRLFSRSLRCRRCSQRQRRRELIGKNHTTRRRDEIDSRCDAGDENAAGKEEARGEEGERQRERRKKKGRSSRQVIERCAPLSFTVAKVPGNECEDSRSSNTCLDEPWGGQQNVSRRKEFREVKTLPGPMGGCAAVNASCKLRENASDGIYGMKFRWFTLFPSFTLRRMV